jgi:hypothetical protein
MAIGVGTVGCLRRGSLPRPPLAVIGSKRHGVITWFIPSITLGLRAPPRIGPLGSRLSAVGSYLCVASFEASGHAGNTCASVQSFGSGGMQLLQVHGPGPPDKTDRRQNEWQLQTGHGARGVSSSASVSGSTLAEKAVFLVTSLISCWFSADETGDGGRHVTTSDREFALSLHPDKTRMIEFGRFAATDRKLRDLNTLQTTRNYASDCGCRWQARSGLQRFLQLLLL